MFIKYTVLLLIFFASSFLSAQEKDTLIIKNEEGVNDTIIIEDDDWNDDWEDNSNEWDRDWDEFKWEFDFHNFHSSPAISVTYGLSEIKRDDIAAKFGKPNLFEAKLGYAGMRTQWADNIIKYKFGFFRISNISTKLSGKDFSNSELESSTWRFGLGSEKGYGWRFGESAIIPYNSFSLDWTRLEMKDLPPAEPVLILLGVNNDRERVLNYHETFRFGTSAQGGVKFKLISGITLEAAYERSIVFERHLFWKWTGSIIIEAAGQGLLDKFIS